VYNRVRILLWNNLSEVSVIFHSPSRRMSGRQLITTESGILPLRHSQLIIGVFLFLHYITSEVDTSLTYLLTYLLTHSLTPWCRILFEKLIVTQLIKKCPALFMEPKVSSPCSQKPATGLSWANWIQFAPLIPIFLRSSLMLSSHLRLGLLRKVTKNK
jgi:hypothetical protein